jgi:hypothetical protein
MVARKGERNCGTRQQRDGRLRLGASLWTSLTFFGMRHSEVRNAWRVRDKTFLISHAIPPILMHTFFFGRPHGTHWSEENKAKVQTHTWAANISVQGPDIQESGMLSSSGETLAGSIEAQWHTQRIAVFGII